MITVAAPPPAAPPPTTLRRRPSAIRLGRAPSFSRSPLASPLASGFMSASASGSRDADFTAEPTAMPETPPSTPPCGTYYNPLGLGFGGEKLVRRNSSLSVASSMGSEDDAEDDADWTEGEKDRLKRTVELYLAGASTAGSPFAAGAIPSNLTHVIARAVVSNKADRVLRSRRRAPPGDGSASGSERVEGPIPRWPHGLKSTRAKIVALVREREAAVDETPRQGDVDATPRRRKPLQRQGSMDFLPAASRNVGIVARLGSKLHRAEQGPPPSHGHPYANASRGRLNRANSLSSIAGSPTQPTKATPNSTSTSSRAPNPSVGGSMARASSRMLRVASDHSAGHHSSSDYFNFNKRSESSGSLHPMMALDLSDREVPASRAASALLGLAFAEAPKQAKKASPAGGLASAFHSPALEYPSPVSLRKNKSSPRGATSSKKQRLDFGAADSSSSSGGEPSEDDLEMGTPSPSPSRLGLDAFPFPSTTLTTPSGRTVAPLDAARERFYLSGSDAASSTSSWTPSSYFSSASSDASASTLSLGFEEDEAMGGRTPSPASSTLDLNELNLGPREDDDDEKTDAEDTYKGWNGWARKGGE